MQLSDSLHNQLAELPERLQISLQDIANKIDIKSYYSIKHQDYESVDLPESITSRFEQLPLEIQTKHLCLQLRNFLYSAYYNVATKPTINSDQEEKNDKLPPNFENKNLFGVDLEFYDLLHTRNKSEGYWSHNWQVIREETDGTLAVHKNGLTLHVNSELHLLPTDQKLSVGKFVSIKMPKNLVQNGFYMAVANAGSQNNHEITRIYFNFTPEGAVAVMESLTEELNHIGVSFSFKALYNPSEYRRYDSGVLYFSKGKYEVVHPILQKIYAENQSYFQEQVPLFTKLLAPGLACAEEPDQKFGEQESFGTNRCQIIANGLIDAWQQGNNSPEDRMASIFKHFSLHKIQLQRPYLNSRSKDIYTLLQ
ncbi:T3SS effector HopA1 family protein [Anabaena sp. UHCC 0451]|uniref:T3SS effector HopA1 family protein n=1 Tax=Anabaena sp. UHCC 0451 TaxID=2055235 RepID=UPI002B1ECAA1|nr:T3SS effector HopA1 family protein [Anabaena sp. UHCC 0451]MEA5578145.1 T3SS effector HopA1 family protein [Anabaena sp. UHCC 0451]